MAGSKVNNYGIGDVNATSIMETLDAQRIGYDALTLTNMDNTTKPAIAAGSKIEINGALFEFDSEEAISGTPSDGTVYILLTPSGDSVTAEFTNTAPTWSEKQGWYGTGGNANYRYANYLMTKSGTDYSDKIELVYRKTTNFLVNYDGDITCVDIDASGVINTPDLQPYAATDAGTSILSDSIGAGLAFYIKKPITAYVTFSVNSGSQVFNIRQASDWRTAYDVSGGATTFGLQLNPGYYRLYNTSGSVTLYCTGVYGSDDIDATKILESI